MRRKYMGNVKTKKQKKKGEREQNAHNSVDDCERKVRLNLF